jgi:hypothetical protein
MTMALVVLPWASLVAPLSATKEYEPRGRLAPWGPMTRGWAFGCTRLRNILLKQTSQAPIDLAVFLYGRFDGKKIYEDVSE